MIDPSIKDIRHRVPTHYRNKTIMPTKSKAIFSHKKATLLADSANAFTPLTNGSTMGEYSTQTLRRVLFPSIHKEHKINKHEPNRFARHVQPTPV